MCGPPLCLHNCVAAHWIFSIAGKHKHTHDFSFPGQLDLQCIMVKSNGATQFQHDIIGRLKCMCFLIVSEQKAHNHSLFYLHLIFQRTYYIGINLRPCYEAVRFLFKTHRIYRNIHEPLKYLIIQTINTHL